MRRALVGALALALGAGPIGVFLMLRRMSLVGDAMAHAILPGAAIGFLLSGLSLFAMTAGGLIAGFVVAVGAGVVARVTELKEDASLAAFFLISLAVGVTIVSLKGTNIDLLHFLFGSVLALDDQTLLLIAGITTLTLARAGADLPAAGAGMRRSGLPALGQPRRRAGAHRVPGAGRDQSRRRLPCARHAARGRHHDAAGRDRAVLGARHHRDDPDRGRERRGLGLRGPAALVPRRRAVRARDHPGRGRALCRLGAVRHASAACCASCFPGAISKREACHADTTHCACRGCCCCSRWRTPVSRAGEAEGRRDLLDPRRSREECRRRPRRRDEPGRAERRRACLSAVARRREDAGRRQGGVRQRARLRGLDRPADQGVRHQGRDGRRHQGREAAQGRRTMATAMAMPIRMPGSRWRMRRSMSPISATRSPPPIRPARRLRGECRRLSRQARRARRAR